MRRYTTPTIPVRIEGADLTGCDVYMTFRQGRTQVDIGPMSDLAIDGTTATFEVTLTQEQSALFKPRDISVEINVIDPSGFRDATAIKTIRADSNLLERVIAHG